MNSVHQFEPHPSAFDDDAWEDLLNFIEEKRVIPIIGPELLNVETENGPRLFYDWLADKLAAKLNVDTAQLPQPYNLNDVVCWFLSTRGRREDTYTRIRSILREITFEPPKALRQLAEITDFDLFVTTTFDSFLEQAINNQRFGGAQSTEVISYTPNRVADITSEREQLQRPVVYHLLGKCSAPVYTRVRTLTCCRNAMRRSSLPLWSSANTSPTSRGSDNRRRLAMRKNNRASQLEKLLPISRMWLCSNS